MRSWLIPYWPWQHVRSACSPCFCFCVRLTVFFLLFQHGLAKSHHHSLGQLDVGLQQAEQAEISAVLAGEDH
ncbi:hypothetical protein FIBSPDRAFT_442781 [Athelia psychrophila]|uniref:Uncharacterized protein n=1 Tax=Athelia psychrophila TaxID=1759441 RepID=A0A166MJ08_9AGAM|nr:hypothetical protein FIBSPDRAFT_442781 [Fibularhizoctonia sp. CBS 109695]